MEQVIFKDIHSIVLPENENFKDDFHIFSFGDYSFVSETFYDRQINDFHFPIVFCPFLGDNHQLSIKNIESENFMVSNSIIVELTGCPKGVKFELLRKQLKKQKYFYNNQPFIFRSENSPFIGTIADSSDTPNFEINNQTLIKFKGKNVVSIDNVGGQPALIKWLNDDYLFSLKASKYLHDWHIPVPTGLLLHGTPGNGKTLFAKAISAELGMAFFTINSAETVTASAGDGDRKILEIFKNARQVAPSIIFIDEVESLCLIRKEQNSGFENRIATVLLNEMDGLTSNDSILVIGATNRPDLIDFAFKRPGRFSYQIKIENPATEGRLEILKIHTQNFVFENNDNSFLSIVADKTEGFSGARLSNLAFQAGKMAIKECLNKSITPIINLSHFIVTLNSNDYAV